MPRSGRVIPLSSERVALLVISAQWRWRCAPALAHRPSLRDHLLWRQVEAAVTVIQLIDIAYAHIYLSISIYLYLSYSTYLSIYLYL